MAARPGVTARRLWVAPTSAGPSLSVRTMAGGRAPTYVQTLDTESEESACPYPTPP